MSSLGLLLLACRRTGVAGGRSQQRVRDAEAETEDPVPQLGPEAVRECGGRLDFAGRQLRGATLRQGAQPEDL